MTTDAWRVYCFLRGRPKLIRGTGGWGTVQREGRRSLSRFEGSETPAYEIELRMSNDRPAGWPVAEQMRALERLCGWDTLDDDPPPPLLFVANVPHDFAQASQNEWVAETPIEWGESLSTDRGTLLWIDATITLGLYVESATGGLAKAKGFTQRTMKAGWNLRRFAEVHLGDKTRWRDVADLNRDNARCPKSPDYRVKRPIKLLTPPKEPKSKAKRSKRGRR
jgi:hypothetical protein